MAEKIKSNYDKRELANTRSKLLRVGPHQVPSSVTQFNNLIYEKMVRKALPKRGQILIATKKSFIWNWADEKALYIGEIQAGPQISWIRDGGLIVPDDGIAIFTVLPTPKPVNGIGIEPTNTNATTQQEEYLKVVIRIPFSEPLSTVKIVECQVGDMIILEPKEVILKTEYNQAGICVFLCTHILRPNHTISTSTA